MERESLLAILIMLAGGLLLQAFASWPPRALSGAGPAELERASWRRLWYPVVPALIIAAWLCGWALTEPDPVPGPLGPWTLIFAASPFALLFGRAATRGLWALVRSPGECGVSTIGLVQPQVLFSPFLAKQLDDSVIRAALAHERAHALHRDPLRIFLAQLITDLQWPWPAAPRRLEAWLDALELARDDEARAEGVDGADLAAAVLASVRFLQRVGSQRDIDLRGTQVAHARLIGDSRTLRERVSRLLAPLSAGVSDGPGGIRLLGRAERLLVSALLVALALGAAFGGHVVNSLLALTS
jgi:hypothetical protein